jgi:hypothetical protein
MKLIIASGTFFASNTVAGMFGGVVQLEHFSPRFCYAASHVGTLNTAKMRQIRYHGTYGRTLK